MSEPGTYIGRVNGWLFVKGLGLIALLLFIPLFFLGEANLTRAGYSGQSFHRHEPYWLLYAQFGLFGSLGIILSLLFLYGLVGELVLTAIYGGHLAVFQSGRVRIWRSREWLPVSGTLVARYHAGAGIDPKQQVDVALPLRALTGVRRMPDARQFKPARIEIADGEKVIVELSAVQFREDPARLVEAFNREVAARSLTAATRETGDLPLRAAA